MSTFGIGPVAYSIRHQMYLVELSILLLTGCSAIHIEHDGDDNGDRLIADRIANTGFIGINHAQPERFILNTTRLSTGPVSSKRK